MRLYEFSRGVPNGWNPGVRKTVGIKFPRRLCKSERADPDTRIQISKDAVSPGKAMNSGMDMDGSGRTRAAVAPVTLFVLPKRPPARAQLSDTCPFPTRGA
jgi:hypothetical protein